MQYPDSQGMMPLNVQENYIHDFYKPSSAKCFPVSSLTAAKLLTLQMATDSKMKVLTLR